MHEVMRKRLLRKLESLPDEQIYQVLDYIEFLEGKYARDVAAPADGLQRLAERFEDRLRARSVAPSAIGGTMRLIGTAGKMLDGITEMGRDLITPTARPVPTRPIDPPVVPAEAAAPNGGQPPSPASPPSETA